MFSNHRWVYGIQDLGCPTMGRRGHLSDASDNALLFPAEVVTRYSLFFIHYPSFLIPYSLPQPR